MKLVDLKYTFSSLAENFLLALVFLPSLYACSNDAGSDANLNDGRLRGSVSLDGSSTVFPVSEAVVEEFLKVEPLVRVTVGVSGTGGGFEKFIAGEIDIIDASRPIWDSEISTARDNGIDFIEIPIAYDGLSVVVNKANDWVDYLTIEELNEIWRPNNNVSLWSDIRPEWPRQEINLYGPGTDSGSFEYFTEVVNGAPSRSRSDFTASEDDNVLVQGIIGDQHAFGYFGFAYYRANSDRIRIIPIDSGNGPITPTVASIEDGSYEPLRRLMYIYVKRSSLQRQEVRNFVEFYINNASQLAREVGYVALPESYYQEARDRLSAI